MPHLRAMNLLDHVFRVAYFPPFAPDRPIQNLELVSPFVACIQHVPRPSIAGKIWRRWAAIIVAYGLFSFYDVLCCAPYSTQSLMSFRHLPRQPLHLCILYPSPALFNPSSHSFRHPFLPSRMTINARRCEHRLRKKEGLIDCRLSDQKSPKYLPMQRCNHHPAHPFPTPRSRTPTCSAAAIEYL